MSFTHTISFFIFYNQPVIFPSSFHHRWQRVPERHQYLWSPGDLHQHRGQLLLHMRLRIQFDRTEPVPTQRRHRMHRYCLIHSLRKCSKELVWVTRRNDQWFIISYTGGGPRLQLSKLWFTWVSVNRVHTQLGGCQDCTCACVSVCELFSLSLYCWG